MVDAGQGEYVRPLVDLDQLLVGNVSEEADRERGVQVRHGAEPVLIVALVPAAHDPVLDPAADFGRKHLQGLEGDHLALARVQPAHGEDNDLVLRVRGSRGDDRKIGPQRPGCQEDLVGGVREALEQELLRVGRECAHARRVADQPPREPPEQRAAREAQDLGSVERQHEPLRPECLEELQQHHRQHRARLREIDRCVPQLAPGRDQFAGELELADQVVGALEGKPPHPERPILFDMGGSGLRPNLHIVSQIGGGLGDFLGKRGYAAAHRIKLMRDEKKGRGRLSGRKFGHCLVGGCSVISAKLGIQARLRVLSGRVGPPARGPCSPAAGDAKKWVYFIGHRNIQITTDVRNSAITR